VLASPRSGDWHADGDQQLTGVFVEQRMTAVAIADQLVAVNEA